MCYAGHSTVEHYRDERRIIHVSAKDPTQADQTTRRCRSSPTLVALVLPAQAKGPGWGLHPGPGNSDRQIPWPLTAATSWKPVEPTGFRFVSSPPHKNWAAHDGHRPDPERGEVTVSKTRDSGEALMTWRRCKCECTGVKSLYDRSRRCTKVLVELDRRRLKWNRHSSSDSIHSARALF